MAELDITFDINTPRPPAAGNHTELMNQLVDLLNEHEVEIVDARQGETSLLIILQTYATQEYVNGQISTGGADWSSFAEPLQGLRINAAGDTPEGYDVQTVSGKVYNYHNFT